MDSNVVGSLITDLAVHVGNGDLSLGASPDGSNIFKGWIDDVRLYDAVLSSDDIEVAYGDGFGDFGPVVDLDVQLATDISPIPVILYFKDSLGQLVDVQDFEDNETNESAILIEGGTIQNLRADNNSTYRFEILPDPSPQKVFLTISAGAASTILNGDYSQKKSVFISYTDKVTKSENLVGWWKFDSDGSDYSGGHADAKLVGAAQIQTGNGKFGNGALYLDGNESWAEVGISKQVLNVTLEESLIGWWKFDEGSGTTATNFVTGEASGTLINSNFSTTEKKFGNSALHLPTNQSSAKK